MLKYLLGGFIIFTGIVLLYQLGIKYILDAISGILDKKFDSFSSKTAKNRG